MECQPSMMHAKTRLIDDRLSVVGSMKLDLLSMEFLEEGSLLVDDATFAVEFEERWMADLALSRHAAGPLTRRLPAGAAVHLQGTPS